MSNTVDDWRADSRPPEVLLRRAGECSFAHRGTVLGTEPSLSATEQTG